MTQLLVVILYQPNQMPNLLEAWHKIGVPGVTIIHSAGGHRTQSWLQKVGLSAINDLFDTNEVRSKTLMSVIDDDVLLEKAVRAAEEVIEGFWDENKGLLFVVPVNFVEGLRHPEPAAGEQPSKPAPALDQADLITRNTPISQLRNLSSLQPVIVHPEQSLAEVAEVMAQQLGVNVACVVNQRNRLVGLLPLRSLLDDLFMTVVPEEFLAESITLESALDFARLNQTQTAGDAMEPAVWVTDSDTVKDAFVKMHDRKLSGIPVINDLYEVIGYISRIELIAQYIKSQKQTKGE